MPVIRVTYAWRRTKGPVVELRKLDLNLLICLDALLTERSVTRAAERLSLSQPSLSASLSKLRRHFNDELLVRTGNLYQLTPLAAHLKQLTATALAGADRVFSAQSEFDPLTCQREFQVLMSDNAVGVLGRDLASVLSELAPQARLRIRASLTDAVDHAPEGLRGIDALVLPHGWLTDLPHLDLYTDTWMILADERNPAISGSPSMENLQNLPWVATFHAPSAFSTAAQQMRVMGIEPRVDIVTESYLALPTLLSGTNRIALIQAQLAARILPAFGVRAHPCPFDAAPLIQAMWWHPMYQRDPEHELLRDLFAEAATRALNGPAPAVS